MPVQNVKLNFILLLLIVSGSVAVWPQATGGRLTGKVVDKDSKPIANVTVLVTNQTSSEVRSERTGTDGVFSFRLSAGAYKISVESPFEARFDRGKTNEYGPFANIICDESKKLCPVLENIIVDGTSDAKVEFLAVRPDAESSPDAKAAAEPDTREVRDRWRIGFPEYDRYGDKGARGRDVPFKKARWFNPYEQNVLKGDKPILGDGYFIVLSGSSTSGIEIRRTPSGNNVSSAEPESNNFFGRPESLSFNQTIQLSFEFFKGQTVFQPRSWAIKVSPTFSVPNYLNARENGIVNIDVRRGTNRTDYHVSLEEAFGEVKLFDANDNYDSVSVRAGIQPFTADFRGFLYSDNNLGSSGFRCLFEQQIAVQFRLLPPA